MFNLETDLLENTEELKTFLQGNYEKIDLLPGIDAQMHQILIHPITHVVNGEHE